AYIRNNTQLVKQASINKQLNPAIVDELLTVDEQRRALQQKVDDLRRDSNEHARKLKQNVANGTLPTDEDKNLGKEFKNKLKELEPQLKEVEDKYQAMLYQIPNVPANDVPVGPDESGNQMIRQVGKPKTFDFDVKPHEEIMTKLGWLDVDRAVRIGGFRSYFLKGDGLRLEQALLRVALDRLVTAGFEPMSVPVLVNEDAMWGTGYFPWGQEDHYKTQDNQFLTGTAEVALTAYRQGETLTEKELPFQICGISPCFRREVGSYGKDTSGVIRVHQFNKVEQVVYTVADETITREWHEKMVRLAEQLLEDLELPYQVLLMCTGDMGAGQRKKYDIETWFPSQQKYRETHSASYFNDFQSRRLNIKYQAKDGSTKFVYTLNNTMAASPRLLAAIIENYQQPDGSVAIPKLLTF
ncbi:MAG TPA: serine--tRNA ligase, partial [Candidatus Woesebacteria bacterium]|nr:serine--tRNA ligase [Candidatus Woesebacteria bacterium]